MFENFAPEMKAKNDFEAKQLTQTMDGDIQDVKIAVINIRWLSLFASSST
jgi:hypothetical protein